MYHKRWLLLAIEIENELLELERCSDAINEMNKVRRGKQAHISRAIYQHFGRSISKVERISGQEGL